MSFSLASQQPTGVYLEPGSSRRHKEIRLFDDETDEVVVIKVATSGDIEKAYSFVMQGIERRVSGIR